MLLIQLLLQLHSVQGLQMQLKKLMVKVVPF
jgi:hypothetical protein